MISVHFYLFNSARFAQFTTNGSHPQRVPWKQENIWNPFLAE